MAPFNSYGIHNDTGVSLGDTQYAYSRRELNKIINDLRAVRTDEIVRLPKIAVIGNQSAGKSSLIEAISQIQVPRAGGTCTRCPMEVSLTSSDSQGAWQGKVSLRLESDLPSGRRPGVYFFGSTTVKENIPKILRRAQLAILNPARNYTDFINLPDDRCETFQSAKMFSTNTVVLEITGADVDVSFIDLPGIISNVPNANDRHLIPTIQKLAADYAGQEDCLILVVLSMKDDIENQAAAQIASQCDPDKMRTIGVLTKADTVVSEEDQRRWATIAKNESQHYLRHGYYVTRLAPTDELNQNPSWTTTRQRERDFFSQNKVWESPKIRVGTEALTEALSNQLSNMIRTRIPELQNSLRTQKREIQSELNALPENLEENAQQKLTGLCGDFTSTLNEYVNGRGPGSRYHILLKPHFRVLKQRIEATRPRMHGNEITDLRGTKPRLSVYGIKTLNDESTIKELPGEVSPLVYQHLIEKFVIRWEKICLDWFVEVEKITSSMLALLCNRDEYFGRYRSSGLRAEVNKVTEEALAEVGQETRDRISLFCKMEVRRSFNLNTKELEQQAEKILVEIGNESNCEFSTELRIISNVLAYFDFASRRLIETVPMVCEVSIAEGLGHQFRKDLPDKLGLLGNNGLETCARFSQEEESVKEERVRLQTVKETVEKALSILDTAFPN